MNNLTDYELLQHRHLSLLGALQDKGVTCVSNADGRWKVTMPVNEEAGVVNAMLQGKLPVVPYTPVLAGLLSTLHAAIMDAAPAKA